MKDYITWLEKFTVNNPNFFSEDWLYCQNKFSDFDKVNIKKLPLLYELIEIYANNNYIYPKKSEYSKYYLIKYNNIGYKISIILGDGIRFICSRVEINSENNYIDFDDIINNKKQPNTEKINNKLNNFSKLIGELLKEEIPVQAIEETYTKTLTKKLKK